MCAPQCHPNKEHGSSQQRGVLHVHSEGGCRKLKGHKKQENNIPIMHHKFRNTSPPLSGTWCRLHCGRGESPTPSSSTAGAQSQAVMNNAHCIRQRRKCVYTCVCVCSHLPAGFTELLDVDRATQCDDEDSERV